MEISDKEREMENRQILRNLQEIKDIIAEKCNRCDSIYGCLGCPFSKGELMDHIEPALKLMQRVCHIEMADK